MVLPLYDHSPFKWPTPPYVTWLLIAVNVIVFLAQIATTGGQGDAIDQVAALVPASFGAEGIFESAGRAPLTLITYMFLHGSFWHIFGNMIFLWVFGDDIEEALGHWRFLAFYISCGVGAGIAFVLSDLHSNMELIGASGAVAGVIAAYLLFRPCAKVTVLVGLLVVRVRAFWVIGGWAVWQVLEALSRAQDETAYWAHVGGLVTGALLFFLVRPPGVELFECAQPEAASVGGQTPPR